MEKEKQYVIQGLIVDDRMIEILGQAKKNGKTIWAMSDLYFSEEEIQKILDKYHISSFDKVISAKDLQQLRKKLTKQMHAAAAELNFELAATLRDQMMKVVQQLNE